MKRGLRELLEQLLVIPENVNIFCQESFTGSCSISVCDLILTRNSLAQRLDMEESASANEEQYVQGGADYAGSTQFENIFRCSHWP